MCIKSKITYITACQLIKEQTENLALDKRKYCFAVDADFQIAVIPCCIFCFYLRTTDEYGSNSLTLLVDTLK